MNTILKKYHIALLILIAILLYLLHGIIVGLEWHYKAVDPQPAWMTVLHFIASTELFPSLASTLVGAIVLYLAFDRIISAEALDNLRQMVLSPASIRGFISRDFARDIIVAGLEKFYLSNAVATGVWSIVSRYSQSGETYFDSNLRMEYTIRPHDDEYYLVFCDRSWITTAPLNTLNIECILPAYGKNSRSFRLSSFSSREKITWAFLAHSPEKLELCKDDFVIREVYVGANEVPIPEPAINPSSIKYELPLDQKQQRSTECRIVVKYQVKQARKFGFLGASPRLPTKNLTAILHFEDLDSDDVSVVDYCASEEYMTIRHDEWSNNRTLSCETSGWVLPESGVVFSWSRKV